MVSGDNVGGIETLALRLAETVAPTDDKFVICAPDAAIGAALPENVDFLASVDELTAIPALAAHLPQRYPNHDLVFVSLHPWSLVSFFLLRYRLRKLGLESFRSFHLVTHSRAFFFTPSKIAGDLLARVFRSAPMKSTYFMNEPARLAHATHWGRDLSAYPVLRLPLDPTPVRWTASKQDVLRVVSIGRLVPFKGYNRAAPEIVSRLKSEGVDVRWDIWGDGEDRELIAEKIVSHGLCDQVRLHPALPYEDFHRTVASYDAFVGMGTAVLEAGQVGMPVICAIEGGFEMGYGLLADTPLDSVGDVVEGTPQIPLAETIQLVAEADEEGRALIGKRCEDSVRLRSSSLSQFVDAMAGAGAWPVSHSPATLMLRAYAYALLQLWSRRRRKPPTNVAA